MGRILVTEFVSIDGVMEAPGGEDFKYEGWTFDFDRGDEGMQFKLQETLDEAGVLLGRKTYEGFAGAWPQREGEFADKMNSDPKWVVSSTLTDPEWNNTTVLEGEPAEAVRKLRDEVDGTILIAGSGQLVKMLLEEDLVDQLNLMVHPYVLGHGFKVFGDTSDKSRWKLEELKTVGPDGVFIQVWSRDRA